MEATNLADGVRGLHDFNNIIVDKGKEVAKKQEERQKELAMLDLIGNPAGSANSPTKSMRSHTVNHTLRSDKYELSPSKLAALAKVGSLERDGGVNGAAGGGTGGTSGSYGYCAKMERMALNRPRKMQGSNKKYESKHRDSDDKFLSDNDDLYQAGPGRADTPPKNYDDMPKYDSDDDIEPLTAAERGSGKAGNSAITKNKAARNQGASTYDNSKAKAHLMRNTPTDGFMQMNQGTTSNMTNGVKNQMLSPHSSPDGAQAQMSASSSRVSIHNPVEAASVESQEFADGLKYMMEASLNEPGPRKAMRSHDISSKQSYAGSVAGNMSSGINTTSSNITSTPTTLNTSAVSKSAMAMDIAKNKGAVLKKGGVFVRAGGARKARQAAEANM